MTPRAVRAGTAVAIATVAVNIMGMKAINRGPVVTARVSNPVRSASPAPTTAPSATTSPMSTAPSTAAPPYPVEHETVSLADPSRDTPARGDVPAHGGRPLVTLIRRPTGPPGPLPLVVFAHGWNVNPTNYEPLLDAWAAAGYLVAAPTFPDSANTLPGSPVSNYPEQARDVSFVITSLLGGRAGPVDPTRIAVAGHSDGATDVALLALHPSYADPRVRAYLSLSGEIPSGLPGPWGTPTPGALLVAVGTRDQYGLLPRSRQVFEAAKVAPKVLLTVAGGDHMGIYTGSSPEAMAVRHETVRFLDVALQAQGVTSADLTSALDPTGDPSILLTAGPPG
jgi:dienelactone hydrolase